MKTGQFFEKSPAGIRHIQFSDLLCRVFFCPFPSTFQTPFHFWTICPEVLLMVYGFPIQLFSIPYMLSSFPLTQPQSNTSSISVSFVIFMWCRCFTYFSILKAFFGS